MSKTSYLLQKKTKIICTIKHQLNIRSENQLGKFQVVQVKTRYIQKLSPQIAIESLETTYF